MVIDRYDYASLKKEIKRLIKASNFTYETIGLRLGYTENYIYVVLNEKNNDRRPIELWIEIVTLLGFSIKFDNHFIYLDKIRRI